MKIPRYNSGDITVSSGRSLTTGTGASQGLVEIGKTAMNAVNDYGARKNAFDAKMRRLEIETNKSLANSTFYGSNQGYLDNLDSREDYLTPDNWLIDYEKNFIKQETQFKSSLDEQTWNEYKPLFYQSYFETKSKINQKISGQKLVNAKIALDESNDKYKQKIDNATSLKEIKGHYDFYNQTSLKGNVTTGLFNDETYQELLKDTKTWTNNKYLMFQANEGAQTQSPAGFVEIDQGVVLQRLKDKNFEIKDIDGNVLTPDDDLRKEMIKEAKTLFDNQQATFKKQTEIKDQGQKTDFTNEIIGLEAGNADAVNNSKTFLTRLEQSDLSPDVKISLKNSFNTAIKNMTSGKASWNTAEGIQAKAIVTSLVYSGAMDTEPERQIILDLMASGHLKPEDAGSLYSKSIELTKGRNQYKKTLLDRAVKVVLKEVGAGDKAELIKQLSKLSGAERMAYLTSALSNDDLSIEAFNAVNNVFQIVAEGERKGFSYENMLANQRSPNYIINDVIDTYKAPIQDAKFKELQSKINGIKNVYDMTGQQKFDNYYILPSEYFTQKKPALENISIPQRKEGEDVLTYLKRAKTMMTTDINLPSVYTGLNVETLDISDIFITPEVK
jgi:hypothetical protein